ncbi:MAG: hypothetical protein ACAH07_12305 [Methylophilaceae bacterium]|nr:hypothetical protein [Methyloradius sp.]
MTTELASWLRSNEKVLQQGATPKARLLALSSLLSDWNKQRQNGSVAKAETKELSIEDVNVLKEIIHKEVEIRPGKNPDVISDQILFLFIGALQMQTQAHSDDAWKLVHQSIQNFLVPEKKSPVMWVAVASIVLVVAASGFLLFKPKPNDVVMVTALNNSSESATIGLAGPATLSVLLTIYNTMKDGSCQLPQVAMLPIEQREAYLAFINDGTVDVSNVENLKLALAHVHCLYPQKLMYAPL